MSFFGTLMGNLAAKMVLPLALAGGFAGYKAGAFEGMSIPGMGDKASHYDMQARVIGVDQSCRLRYRVDGKLRQTESMGCNRAIDMLRRPEFVGYTVHKSKRVTYSYYSMDGTATLTGSLSGKDAQARAYHKNDVINIRVDAKDPSKSEVI